MNAYRANGRFLSVLRRNPSDDDIRDTITNISSEWPRDAAVASELAAILAASGERLSIQGAVVADVASTGGPASLSTLLTPLFLRAAGATVPKLGVPGRPAGGIDCLAQIPGYRTELSLHEIMEIVNDFGYAHFIAKGEMAPLDGRMFKLRQVMNAQDIPTLVIGSLLSKKLAVGVKYAGLDIRVAPHGNFGIDRNAAAANARLFIDAARTLGIDALPALTDGRHPYQPYLGRREALLALDDIFKGEDSPWLKSHVDTCKALALACLPPYLRARAAELSTVELRPYFDYNLAAQGADPDSFNRIVSNTRKEHSQYILAKQDGFCVYRLDLLRDHLVRWQNMFRSERTPFPDPVGIIVLVPPGKWVSRGTPITTVRAPDSLIPDVIHTLGKIVGTPDHLPIGPNIEAIDG